MSAKWLSTYFKLQVPRRIQHKHAKGNRAHLEHLPEVVEVTAVHQHQLGEPWQCGQYLPLALPQHRAHAEVLELLIAARQAGKRGTANLLVQLAARSRWDKRTGSTQWDSPGAGTGPRCKRTVKYRPGASGAQRTDPMLWQARTA